MDGIFFKKKSVLQMISWLKEEDKYSRTNPYSEDFCAAQNL